MRRWRLRVVKRVAVWWWLWEEDEEEGREERFEMRRTDTPRSCTTNVPAFRSRPATTCTPSSQPAPQTTRAVSTVHNTQQQHVSTPKKKSLEQKKKGKKQNKAGAHVMKERGKRKKGD